MYVLSWLFLGFVAFTWTLVLVAIAAVSTPDTDGLATYGGIVGFVLWLVWSFGALEHTIVKASGGSMLEQTQTHPELALVGLLMSTIPGFIALTGPFDLVRRWRTGDIDEL